jgi:DNA-binding transcriptional ArsR family regulator
MMPKSTPVHPVATTELRAVLLHGLADRSRLAILEVLHQDERRVSDIVDATGLAQSNASRHLACLWDCGLVARHRKGREVYYQLVPGVADLLSATDHVLAEAGDTIGACPRYGRRPRAEAA